MRTLSAVQWLRTNPGPAHRPLLLLSVEASSFTHRSKARLTSSVDVLPVPTVAADRLAWITTADMIEVDRVMVDDLHIGLVQMMENAGRHLARLVLEGCSPSTVAVAAGSGGNGGGGLVAARHLTNADIEVVVVTSRPREEMTPVPAHQLDIVQRMGVEQRDILPDADVVIDSIIGYSLHGAPHGTTAKLIDDIQNAATVVSLDTPSGLDVTSGIAPGTVVSAEATLTLALPKQGLRRSPHVGELYLADISVPPSVTAQFGMQSPRFGHHGIVRIAD